MRDDAKRRPGLPPRDALGSWIRIDQVRVRRLERAAGAERGVARGAVLGGAVCFGLETRGVLLESGLLVAGRFERFTLGAVLGSLLGVEGR